MSFPRKRHFRRRHHEQAERPQDTRELMHPEHTGSESEYLRSLIDSRATVTVVLDNGERFQRRIRYYDRECFSIGPSTNGPKIFVRKASVAYIAEEQ